MKEFLDNGHVIKLPFVMPNNLHSPRNDLKIRSFAFFFFTLAAFILFTQHNDFPFYYHTDEPSKAIQVLTGQRNFHHPLMLLRSTELLVGIAHIPSNPQAVVEAGRSLSGFFAALAVGTLMLLGWNLGGAFAGILCGVLLLSHPVLFELAHYMKEDCALLAGVAATFYSMNCYERKKSALFALCTGLSAGLAVSGKYIGLAVMLIALFQILWTARGSARWIHALVFLFAGALIFSAINWELLFNISGARSGIDNEFKRFALRAEETRGEIKIKYLNTFGNLVSIPILIGSAVWGWQRWKNRRSEPFFTWILLFFPPVFIAALALAPVEKERYLLPSLALFCVLGSLGILELSRLGLSKTKILASLLAVAAVVFHVPTLSTNYKAFTFDDRRELIEWLRENIPSDALIAHDNRVRLDEAREAGDPMFAFPQKILSAVRYVADLGTLDNLKSQGVGYVALCEQDYRRALNPPKNAGAEATERSLFYRSVLDNGKLLWERPVGPIAYLHPGLKLYSISNN